MPIPKGEFIRRLGVLKIHCLKLKNALNQGAYPAIEAESRLIQDLVLDLIKGQSKLSKTESREVRPRFSSFREEALGLLEKSRHILDSSNEYAVELVRSCETLNKE